MNLNLILLFVSRLSRLEGRLEDVLFVNLSLRLKTALLFNSLWHIDSLLFYTNWAWSRKPSSSSWSSLTENTCCSTWQVKLRDTLTPAQVRRHQSHRLSAPIKLDVMWLWTSWLVPDWPHLSRCEWVFFVPQFYLKVWGHAHLCVCVGVILLMVQVRSSSRVTGVSLRLRRGRVQSHLTSPQQVCLVMSAVFLKPLPVRGRLGVWPQVCQLVVHIPTWGSMLLLFVYAPPVHRPTRPRADPRHLPSTLSERWHRARPSPSCRPREELSVGGGGARRWAESGGDTARAGADGGERLLAAVQEGWVVGALMAAVVVVRLTLPLPPTAKDPDERLKTRNKSVPNKRSRWQTWPQLQCCSLQN